MVLHDELIEATFQSLLTIELSRLQVLLKSSRLLLAIHYDAALHKMERVQNAPAQVRSVLGRSSTLDMTQNLHSNVHM